MADIKNAKASQNFVPIKEVRDGVIVMKDGSLKKVLMASSLNLALKSYDEQTSVLLQFQNFLNTLDFSVQVYIQSRRYDIRPYVSMLEERAREQLNDLLKIQTQEYVSFIQNFTESTNIMSKSFFLVVPYYPPTLNSKNVGRLGGFLGKKGTAATNEDFESHKSQLDQRVYVVEQGMIRTGVRTAELGTEEVVELFYRIFNPGEQEKPLPVY